MLKGKRDKESTVKTFMLMAGSGPIVILTSYESPTTAELLQKLVAKGINKFIAYEIPLELAKQRYAGHFSIVQSDLHESDDLRVLDYDGSRAFNLFRFSELSDPVTYEAKSE